MSWITIIWSMGAAAALTLGGIHLVVWLYDRKAWASLAFSSVAFAEAGMASIELAMMRSTTPEEWGRWQQWTHVPAAVYLIGTMCFVWLYVGRGNLWLFWTIVAVRAGILLANFLRPPSFNFRAISTLVEVGFLGEQVSAIGEAVPSPWQWLALASMVALTGFVVHASLKRWRLDRGEGRRRALVVGGAVVAFLVLATGQGHLSVWGILVMPLLVSPPFAIPLVAMAWEISREVLTSRRAHREALELRHELEHTARVTTMETIASALAHELRQPLGAIQRNAEAADLLLQTGTPNLVELREIIADIHKDDQRAGAVITRLRALLERRSVDVQPLSVAPLLRETLALVRPEATARRVSVECAPPADLPTASGDWVQLSQVLLNLLLNALDAVESCPEGKRSVVVDVRSKSAGELEISVTDSGPGIAPGLKERIFEPFFTTKKQGMGIGLPLSRSIVEAHGGRLWVEPHATGGACFRWTLPVARSASPQPSQTPAPLEGATSA